jgi:hypothetical protein
MNSLMSSRIATLTRILQPEAARDVVAQRQVLRVGHEDRGPVARLRDRHERMMLEEVEGEFFQELHRSEVTRGVRHERDAVEVAQALAELVLRDLEVVDQDLLDREAALLALAAAWST